MPNISYAEGTWFAVPLRDTGFGVGVVARANPQGVLLGYFFGPKHSEPPALDDVVRLGSEAALMVRRFGHLGLSEGRWPIMGRPDDWDPAEWPMPVFVRYEELTGRSFQVFYDESDPNKLLREVQVAPGTGEHGPKDGVLGAGAVEIVLTGLLRS